MMRVPAGRSSSKFVRPSGLDVAPRSRLFNRLDKSAQARCVWISAPGGYGKTALVSKWIEARQPPSLWFQCDAGDADLAAFFHFLTLAARRARPRRRWTFAKLTPEYALGIGVYVRRFFEELFAGLGPSAQVVLDDYHEVPADAPLHAQLDHVLTAVPTGSRLIVLSRRDPPAGASRWLVGRSVERIDAGDLALTNAEAKVLARAIPHRSAKLGDVARLNRVARGWTAGVLLLLRSPNHSESGESELNTPRREVVFDYLATEVFARSDPALQRFLLQTAWLPAVTPALARRLTGREDAASVLEALARQRFFIDRRSGPSLVYEYHPLMRHFLRESAAKDCAPATVEALKIDSARALEAIGEDEDALVLYLNATSSADASRLILARAPECMAQGRSATIEDWIDRLPEETRANDPWLEFWRGTCRSLHDPMAGRGILEEAYARFKTVGDHRGCLVCWSGISESYFLEMGDFSPMQRWVDEIETLLPTGQEFPDPALEARVIGGAMGLLMHRPDHPFILMWANRGLMLASRIADMNARVQVCGFTSWVWLWRGDLVRSAEAWRLCTEGVDIRQVSPMHRMVVALCTSIVSWHLADHDGARKSIDDALALADATGIHVVDTLLNLVGVYAALNTADLVRARLHLARARTCVPAFQLLELTQIQFMQAGIDLSEGHVHRALALAEPGLARAESFGVPFPLILFRIETAQMMMLVGRHAEARSLLLKAASAARAMNSQIAQFHCGMYLAWSLFETNEESDALATLRQALAIGAGNNYMNCHPWWLPSVMSRLLSRALENSIEVEYVRRFIWHRDVRPESIDVPDWPWPVRLRALGTFGIEVDGQAVHAQGKAQVRLVAFIKALLAAGGQGVLSPTLIDRLWPDAEGDAGRSALDVTLHRARRLLGRAEALSMREGRVSFNRGLVWTDIWAFESLVARLDRSADDHRWDAQALADAQAVLSLYSGNFLADEPSLTGVDAVRERLRHGFHRVLLARGRTLQKNGRWADALVLWRSGIERDATAEALYQEAMHCLGELGLASEVVRTYDALREALAQTLNVQPSARSRELRDRYARDAA